MKEYTVEWIGAETEDSVVHTIEAENYRDAFDTATKNHKYPYHPRISVCGDGFLDNDELDNPHYGEEAKKPATLGGGGYTSQSQQPEISDGSVGWFEKVDGSSLTEKQILLAQLNELRTIKRCVVSTVVIVIVIPLIVGGIVSG